MKRIQIIFLGLVLLLAACTSTATEPAVSEPSLPADDSLLIDDVPELETAVDESPLPETAVNEKAAKPQFIMFTASW